MQRIESMSSLKHKLKYSLNFRHSILELRSMFENLRPFFVKPAKRRDRITCLCKHHHELQVLFQCAKSFRNGLVERNIICSETFHVWHKLQDLVKINHKEIHALCCLDRTCSECGVDKLNLCAMEKDTSDSETITWRKYKYCETGKTNKKGQETKKNKLVDESSGLMWECSRDKNCPPIRCTNSKQIGNVSK